MGASQRLVLCPMRSWEEREYFLWLLTDLQQQGSPLRKEKTHLAFHTQAVLQRLVGRQEETLLQIQEMETVISGRSPSKPSSSSAFRPQWREPLSFSARKITQLTAFVFYQQLLGRLLHQINWGGSSWLVPGATSSRVPTWDTRWKTMQKREGESINCSESHSLLHPLPGISGKSHHTESPTQPPQPPEKKTLLRFNSQKKTNTGCLSLWLLLSLKTKQVFKSTGARGRVGRATE